MDRHCLFSALDEINKDFNGDCKSNFIEQLNADLVLVCDKFALNYNDINNLVQELDEFNDDTVLRKYVILNVHFLLQFNKINNEDTLFNINELNTIKSSLRKLIRFGICCNLQPKMPQHEKFDEKLYDDESCIINQYNCLATTTYGIFLIAQCAQLKKFIIYEHFQQLFNSLYQIVYCPIKRPEQDQQSDKFHMSAGLYEKLQRQREQFKHVFDYFVSATPCKYYVQQTMLLLNKNNINWFKKSISWNLTQLLYDRNGLETIIVALLENTIDYDPNDCTKTWKTFDIVMKLIQHVRDNEGVRNQTIALIQDRQHKHLKAFEAIYVNCIKILNDDILLSNLLTPLNCICGDQINYERNKDVSELYAQIARLLYALFVKIDVNHPKFDVNRLTPQITSLFCLYSISATLRDFNKLIAEILIHYLHHLPVGNILDKLFAENAMITINLCVIDEKLIIKDVNYELERLIDVFLCLVKPHNNLLLKFYVYLLKFVNSANEQRLITFNLLAKLSEDKSIQSEINKQPTALVDCLQEILTAAIDKHPHPHIINEDCDEYQTIFVCVMILHGLVHNTSVRDCYKGVMEVLRNLMTRCRHDELHNLICDVLKGADNYGDDDVKVAAAKPKTELNLILDEVFDPLLPVQGHGLQRLGKFVESKHREAMDRKMFILNLFQQHLQHKDTYIYLAAINGLAAMGDVLPEIVLNTMCEEFLDLEKDAELRMKIGEVLVKVVKTLGDRTAEFKALLLNTLLHGTKDDDHLIKASSLSNLGEVCRVLGYKLGTIYTEVLTTIHDVINNDNAIEAKRAAVTVLRQLFIGLESETIRFLQDDILEIYRTLKDIYNNDSDEVMRLQAQLTLEELNTNVLKFLFANPYIDWQLENVKKALENN